MRLRQGIDEITPAFDRLYRNSSPAAKLQIMKELGNNLRNTQKRNIANELQYDGRPMKSPAKETKYDGRFAESYKWRYRVGFRQLTSEEKRHYEMTGRVGGARGYHTKGRRLKQMKRGVKVRRRIPVTPASKQLQDTGGTIKSIDILSADPNKTCVGPKTAHGKKILAVHEKTRKPFGISKKWATWAQGYAFNRLLKGV